MSQEREYGWIVKTPGVLGGKPRVDGKRISVQHIAIDYEHWRMSPEEMCKEYPGLTLGQVHAALAYYYDHREEIQKEIEEGKRFAEEYRQQHPDRVR